VATAALSAGDRVVEVGPGLGVLTRRLLEAGCEVVAIEIDPHLVGYLHRELDDAVGLTLLEEMRWRPIQEFPGQSYQLVANIPPHHQPALHLFLGPSRPERAVLLCSSRSPSASQPSGRHELPVGIRPDRPRPRWSPGRPRAFEPRRRSPYCA
jgi:hypothetical protein